jgi:hypothetical protein
MEKTSSDVNLHETGLFHDSSLSPFLYAQFLDVLLRRLEQPASSMLGELRVASPAYADDIALVAESHQLGLLMLNTWPLRLSNLAPYLRLKVASNREFVDLKILLKILSVADVKAWCGMERIIWKSAIVSGSGRCRNL